MTRLTLLPFLLVLVTQNDQTDTVLPFLLVSVTQNDQIDTVTLSVGISKSE